MTKTDSSGSAVWENIETSPNRQSPNRRLRPLRKLMVALASATCFALASAGVTSADAACQKPDPLRVVIYSGAIPTMLTFIAKDAGFFEKNCLDVSLVPMNSGPAALSAVASNSVQIADSVADNVIVARGKGVKLKIVSNQSAANPYSLVVSNKLKLPHEKEGYPAVMKDLVGKKIGVYALGTNSSNMVGALLRGAGLNPNQVTFVAVGPPPSQLAALKNGAVDAVIMISPAQDLAQAQKYGRVVVDLRKKGVGPKDIQGVGKTFQVKVATDQFIAANPDIMKRYLKSNTEASEWIRNRENFPQLLKYMAGRVKIGSEVPNGEQMFKDLMEFWASVALVEINREAIDAWNQFVINSGNVAQAIPYEDLVWSGAPVMK